jgi:uncharacterized protein
MREDLLDLNEALQHPGTRLEFEIKTELPNEENIDLLDPISGTIEAISTGNILIVTASLDVHCVVECAKCGRAINKRFAFKMEDEFPVEGTPSSFGSGTFAHVEPEEVHPLFEENLLIEDAYLRQGLLLNMPLQPLCGDSWDDPCPGEDEMAVEKHSPKGGHPGMQNLDRLLSNGEEVS